MYIRNNQDNLENCQILDEQSHAEKKFRQLSPFGVLDNGYTNTGCSLTSLSGFWVKGAIWY